MIAKVLPGILSIIIALLPSVEAAPEFEYGQRPPFSIFDPTGVLSYDQAKEISDPLTSYFKNEGIDVIVVVLTDLGEAPPEHVASRFAAAWCGSPIHCVVLHVPGRDDSPWIIPAGKLVERINPDQITRAVSDARRHAISEPKDPDKIRTAATESADMLRYWMANAINQSEKTKTERAKIRLEQEAKSREWKIATLMAAASCIPLLGVVWLLVVFFRNRRPVYFPDHEWQPRLGAPHAGGNRAISGPGSANH
ncbi:MAG: TPM domain-containing protein [Verrucomicrobiota bacterium]